MSFADVGRKVAEGAAAGAYQAGTVIMAASQEVVPVEYGTLKRSGRVEDPVVDGDTVTVTVGYGYGTEYETRVAEEDAADPEGEANSPGYAVYVHEIERYQHAPPTMAKYLERPARALEPEVGSIIGDAVRAKIREQQR